MRRHQKSRTMQKPHKAPGAQTVIHMGAECRCVSASATLLVTRMKYSRGICVESAADCERMSSGFSAGTANSLAHLSTARLQRSIHAR
jgi:hypothetical protein